VDLGLVLAAAGLVFAGVVKGTVGFGLPMIAAPVLAGFVEPRVAVVVMSIVNTITAIQVAARVGGVSLRAHLGLLGQMGFTTAVGTIFGAQLLAVLSPVIVSVLVGCVAVAFALLSAASVQLKVPPPRRGLVGSLVGLGAGLLGAVTSVSATPVVMYFHALELPKRDFLVVLNVTLVGLSLVQVASYAALGLYSVQVLQLAAVTMVCVAVGLGVGFVIQERVNQRLFNRVVIFVIFVVGLSLVVRALAA
jgi:uncharacterized membrane protein YfcA